MARRAKKAKKAKAREQAKRREAALLEVHLDLAGDYVADRLFPAATGVDLLETTLLHLAGRERPPARPLARPAAVRFVYAEDLAADGDAKMERLRALSDDLEVDAAIPATGEGGTRRVGCVLARAPSVEGITELTGAMDRILGR